MKSEKLLPFYFGALGDSERLQIERTLLEEPDALIDYFDIKRKMEEAALLPRHPSPRVWAKLSEKLQRTPKKKLYFISFGFAAAVAALLFVLFMNKPRPQSKFEPQGNGFLFEGGEPSGNSGVL